MEGEMNNVIGRQLRQSTGLNSISGDIKINYFYKLIWHFINFIENHLPDRLLDNSLEIKYHKVPQNILLSIISNFPKSLILPRALCDIFWNTLPWSDIEKELGEFNILDIGCGGARAFNNIFSKMPDKNISPNLRYTGVDMSSRKNWNELRANPNVKLFKEDICKFLEEKRLDFNIIVSQSSLEHIKPDLYIHKLLSKYLSSNKQTTLQIHLVPARACHSLYGRHGYRHYSKYKLSKISKLYADFSKSFLFPLGDRQINIVHKQWGKGDSPETPRFKNQSEYVTIFRNTLKKYYANLESDNFTCSNPTYYALVIYSNPKPEFNINFGSGFNLLG